METETLELSGRLVGVGESDYGWTLSDIERHSVLLRRRVRKALCSKGQQRVRVMCEGLGDPRVQILTLPHTGHGLTHSTRAVTASQSPLQDLGARVHKATLATSVVSLSLQWGCMIPRRLDAEDVVEQLSGVLGPRRAVGGWGQGSRSHRAFVWPGGGESLQASWAQQDDNKWRDCPAAVITPAAGKCVAAYGKAPGTCRAMTSQGKQDARAQLQELVGTGHEDGHWARG